LPKIVRDPRQGTMSDSIPSLGRYVLTPSIALHGREHHAALGKNVRRALRGTTSTGQGARATTFSVTLPKMM